MKWSKTSRRKYLRNNDNVVSVGTPCRKRDGSNQYLTQIKKLRRTIPSWENFFSVEANNTRMNDWIRLDVLGEPLAQKYSWAIPDDRSLRILSEFQPLVEIGCGKGYWSHLLQRRGVDIIACDTQSFEDSWTEVPKTLLLI